MISKSKAIQLKNLCYLLYGAPINVDTLKVKYKEYSSTKEVTNAINKKKSRFTIHRYPLQIYGSLFNVKYCSSKSEIVWKRPYYFKKESSKSIGRTLFSKENTFRDSILVDGNRLIEKSSRPNSITDELIADVEKNMGLIRKDSKFSLAMEETYANYLALKEIFINPIRYLVNYDFEFVQEAMFLERRVLFARAVYKIPIMFRYGVGTDPFDTVGDYTDITVDIKTGLLLKRDVYYQKEIIESFEIIELEYG